MTIAAAVMSSARTRTGRDDWRTPTTVLDRVRRIGPIALDPCGNPENSVGARVCYWGEPDSADGLACGWSLGGLVFVNPPYSQFRAWAAKAALEAKAGTQLIMLVPARTDTQAWRIATGEADCVALWRGRLTFVGGNAPAPFPSALIACNVGVRAMRRAFGDVADVWVAP